MAYTQTNKECEEFQLLSYVSFALLVSTIHACITLAARLYKKTTFFFKEEKDREGKRGVDAQTAEKQIQCGICQRFTNETKAVAAYRREQLNECAKQ